MPPKRSAPQEISGRQKKRLRVTASRSISVQGVGTSSRPSKSNDSNGLPDSIDVEKFVESRSFEITAMQEAMKNLASTHRAWQELPRHLRRRAASHRVRRVPLRLRNKSRTEMDTLRRKILGRPLPKRGKARRELRSDIFARRQRDKKWLETHLWHSKRMHMENMWGYRLSVNPTEKSFRPSHRASVHGSILHDASYYGLVELKGAQIVLCRALELCCDPVGAGPSSKRFLSGVRGLETAVYEAQSYPFGYIGPISIIWRPMDTVSQASQATDVSPTSKPVGHRKRRPAKKGNRIQTVWIRCHPAIFSTVLLILKGAVSLTLDTFNNSPRHSQKSHSVEVIDLRESINVFEITGPKSSQVVHGALTPTNAITTANLKSFPPKNTKAHIAKEELPTISRPWECFPSSSLSQSDIWDKSARDVLEIPRFKKKELDARLLLVQRSVRSSSASLLPQSFPRTTQSDPNLHGWTLIVPKGWGMPFFTSLVYTGTRVGGQRERAHQAFEAGAAYFPRDFPTSAAYEEFAAARATVDEERWKRKPPAKRVNWENLSVLNPWTSAWRAALGLDTMPSTDVGADYGSNADMVPTQRDHLLPASDPAIRPWLLHGSHARVVIENIARLLSPAAGLFSEINALRRKRELTPLDESVTADSLLRAALVHVRVMLCGRGVPDDMAFIYALEDKEAQSWAKAHSKRKPTGYELGEEPADATELSKLVPSNSAVIGFVTSGNFSLSRGKGYAIGAISLVKFLETREQADRLRQGSDWLVKVRNRDEMICRAARVDYLE
ncbi:POP1-domain-containing protein [Russula earlei]|uniref:POP1-domain-containing protein n=1 Tax=Russula earlei TaxID=71964 RepID=A0ACC0U0J3_9AGAM|nr:POP1-domain-containing protein [Russula earlei]